MQICGPGICGLKKTCKMRIRMRMKIRILPTGARRALSINKSRQCLTLTLSLGVIPSNIAINDISLKLDFLVYIFAAESIDVYPTTFT